MNIKHLEAFMKIVDCGGYFQAAEELFTTQSSLSKQMQTLERELNVTLFDRSGRASKLTESGHILYEKTPAFLARYKDLLNSIGATNHVLNLAVLPVWEHYGIPQCIMDFTNVSPHIELNVRETQNSSIPEVLRSGASDLGICRLLSLPPDEWNYLPLMDDELVLVVPEDAPYADLSQVSLSDFRQERFILLGRETQLYEHSMKACMSAGFSPKTIYQGSSAETIHFMVANKKGVALFMKQVALDQKNTNNKILYIQETIKSDLVLAYRKNHRLNEAGRLFWNYMKNNLYTPK